MTSQALDLDRIVAIDVHTHAERNPGESQDPVTLAVLDAAGKYFGGPAAPADRAGGR